MLHRNSMFRKIITSF